ncbi:hypothetical protein [Mycolicibacterium mengxianglii]|uniref:hypothetical protein n=1 Tax=Mycolicibacterium mengxianglii TaxID=2736649 RepID=UPI0018D0FA6C|nr:hypothetical protein [Mycolicibacterium mengxianglii]
MAERPKRENWQDSPPRNWAEREAHRLSLVIQELRRGRSAQWLSDRTDELGHRVSRSVISDLETGRRRYLTTVELAVMAAALNTSPVALVYPNPSDDLLNLVEVLPGVQATGFQAAQWFSGERPGFTDSVAGSEAARVRAEFRENTRLLRLWRQIADLRERQMQHSHTGADGRLTDAQRELIEQYQRQIDQLQHELGIDHDV